MNTDRGTTDYDLQTDCHAENDVSGTSTSGGGPMSQIPGLSQSASNGPEEKARGRRVGVLETDSVYTKLAKQGGQRGLLWHEETNLETKPNPSYQPTNWFSGAPGPHDKSSPTEKSMKSPNECPFGSDNKSTWEREADNKDKVCENDHSSQLDKLSLTTENDEEACKFKKTSHDKKPVTVNMSKLLSFGYQDEKSTASNNGSKVTTQAGFKY